VSDHDLFGEIPAQVIDAPKPKGTQPKGYAGIPGSGPEGKKCRHCAHYIIRYTPAGYTHPKCDLMRHRWTSGRGSDIKVSSPACGRFEPELNKQPGGEA